MVLPTIAALIFSMTQSPVYEASATLLPAQFRLAGDPDITTVASSRLVGMATNYSYAAESPDVLSSVRRQLNLTDTNGELSRRIDATVNSESATLTITARSGTAAAAAALANGIAHAIEELSSVPANDESLVANIEAIRQRMLETEAEYERLLALPPPLSAADTADLGNSLTLLRELTNVNDSLTAALNKTPSGLIVVDEADAQFAQMIAPRTVYYMLLAAVAGLILAAGIATGLDHLDDTVKKPGDIDAIADLPTLGTVGSRIGGRGRRGAQELATLFDPQSSVAEAYRTLRTSIEFASIEAPIQTLLVTSSLRGEGKTITAANLAVAFAQGGRRVLLVDADLRTPSVHRVFNARNAHGLTTLLRNDSVGLEEIVQVTQQANLRILTTGPLPPNPVELLGGQRIRTTLDRLKADYDLVILDGPPLDAVTDSALLSSFLDGTLFVIAAGRSRRAEVLTGSELLARAHAKVLGAVLYGGPPETFPQDHDDTRLPVDAPVTASRAGERANPS